MSMHEYENVVEDSVRFLDERCSASGLDLRSFFKCLYDFQSRYDTKHTHFRVIGPLLKHRYLYAFALHEHPEYERYRGVFQALRGFCGVYRHPNKEWSEEDNPEIGFYCNPTEEWGARYADEYPPELRHSRLYCEAGSELWGAFVKAGKLTGQDAEPPTALPIQKVVATIAREAAKHEDRFIVREWLPLLCYEMMSLGLPALMNDPDVQTLRRIAKQMNVLSLRDEFLNYSNLAIPPDDIFGDENVVNWWLALNDV